MLVAIILDLLIAAFVGWCTGKIMGYNTSTLGNILIGIIGGVVGSVIVGLMGAHASGLLSGLLVSIFGSCVLVFLYRLIKK